MTKPVCSQCKRKDKIKKVHYGCNESPVWIGYECERCYCVVKELFNAEENPV